MPSVHAAVSIPSVTRDFRNGICQHAESVNGGGGPNQPPKEMSMEVRLLLAFLLMGAVMFLTPYLFKTVAPPPVKKVAQSAPGPWHPAAAGPGGRSPAPVAKKAKAERPARKGSSKAVPSAPSPTTTSRL